MEFRIGYDLLTGAAYYVIGAFRSADLFANQPSAVAAARRPQRQVMTTSGLRLKPVYETVEW